MVRRALAGLFAASLASCAAPPAPLPPESDDRAILAIEEGRYERGPVDSYDLIIGPPEVVTFMNREADGGKVRLRALLDSPKKYVRYFAVLALSQIADAEARSILSRWARRAGEPDLTLARIAAVRLIWRNDFSLRECIRAIPSTDTFALMHVFGLARYRFGLESFQFSEDPHVNEGRLKEFNEMLDDVPEWFMRTLR